LGNRCLKTICGKDNPSKLIFDLLVQSPDFDVDSSVQIAEKTYQTWLFNMLEKVCIDQKQLERAEIRLEFSTFEEFPKAIRDTRGDPYVCTVILLNTNGISYSASKIGVCASHNPTKDRRSNRVTVNS
jgi:hypothetical protein